MNIVVWQALLVVPSRRRERQECSERSAAKSPLLPDSLARWWARVFCRNYKEKAFALLDPTALLLPVPAGTDSIATTGGALQQGLTCSLAPRACSTHHASLQPLAFKHRGAAES